MRGLKPAANKTHKKVLGFVGHSTESLRSLWRHGQTQWYIGDDDDVGSQCFVIGWGVVTSSNMIQKNHRIDGRIPLLPNRNMIPPFELRRRVFCLIFVLSGLARSNSSWGKPWVMIFEAMGGSWWKDAPLPLPRFKGADRRFLLYVVFY